MAVNVAAEPWEIYKGGIFEGGGRYCSRYFTLAIFLRGHIHTCHARSLRRLQEGWRLRSRSRGAGGGLRRWLLDCAQLVGGGLGRGAALRTDGIQWLVVYAEQ